MRIIFVCIIFLISSCKKGNDGPGTSPQPPTPVLNSNVSSVTLGALDGSKDSINITSNINWTISLSPTTASWATLSSAAGSNNAKVYIIASQTNTTGSQRSASIILTPVGTTALQAINISLVQNFQAPQTGSFLLQWQKALGGTEIDNANSVAATSDGGCIIAGKASSNDGDITGFHGGGDFWIIKLNSNGAIEWQKALGGTSSDEAKSIIASSDGGYVVVGVTSSIDGNVVPGSHGTISDAWVVKLNSTGNIIWQKVFGGNLGDQAFSVTECSNGDLLIAGLSLSTDGNFAGNHGQQDMWVMRLTNTGNLIWQKLLGGSSADQALSIIATSDGGSIIAGISRSNDGDVSGNHGDADCWIVKLNTTGDITWQKSFGGSGFEYANSIAVTSDGGFIIAGPTESNNGDISGYHGGSDAWVFKITSAGNIVWQKSLGDGTNEIAKSIAITPSGDIVVAGLQGIDCCNGFNCWITKLKSDGNIVEQKILGGSEADWFESVTAVANGEFIAVGYTASSNGDVSGYHGGYYDGWAVKFKFQ